MDYGSYDCLIFERHDHGVLQVTMNRPEKYNAAHEAMHGQLARVWTDIARDEETRAVVVTGAGKAFSAGGSFELPAILLEVRITTKIFPGEAGRVERPQFLIRARRPPIGAAHRRRLHWQVADHSACREDTR